MIITFLGTGTSQGVPVIACSCEVCRSVDFRDKRLRSSLHVQTGDKSLVIDTGPDFRQQMLEARIRRVDAVLFTHEHKDHTAGLDDIRAFNYIQRESIPAYGEERVINQLKSDFQYVVESAYPGIPQVDFRTIGNEPFSVKDVQVTPIRVYHHKLPVFGFRIGELAYVTDAKFIEDREKEKLKGARVLIINALRKEEHISHLTLKEALELIEEAAPDKAYITHISHHLGLHKIVEEELPENVFLGYDGLKIEL